jgi:hypothetical protein
MISERIENFWESLFDKNYRDSYSLKEGVVLLLPLERNAMEQTGFAQWVYGDGLSSCLTLIQQLEFSENQEDYFQFTFQSNSFTFSKPVELGTNEFYYFFDYLKEAFRDKGYLVTESVKEGVTDQEFYQEIERYVLVNKKEQRLVKLEVINDKVNVPLIRGLGYPSEPSHENTVSSNFFEIVRGILG